MLSYEELSMLIQDAVMKPDQPPRIKGEEADKIRQDLLAEMEDARKNHWIMDMSSEINIDEPVEVKKYDEAEARDPKGEWTTGGAQSAIAKPTKVTSTFETHLKTKRAGWAAQEKMERLKRELLDKGGFTYQPFLKRSPKTGFALSIYPEREAVLDKVQPKGIRGFIDDNKDMWSNPRNYVGGWYNTEDKKVYLDVSMVVDDPKEAEDMCKKHNQYAYFDLGKKEEVRVQGQAEITKMDGARKLVRFQLPSDVTDEELEEFCKKLEAGDEQEAD